jgi:hypothetical protein
MGRFLGSWDIDDVVRVHVQTSSVTTGAAVDADSVPTWRVYEDDTATPVTTGSFVTLNSQTGFYVANITLAAAIGYEVGKSYAVRTQVTVASIIGADVHSFQIQSEVRLAAGAITAGVITAGALQGFTLGSVAGTVGSVAAGVTVSSTSQAAIVDGVWDEPKTGHTTADTYGEYLDATVSGIGAAGAVTVGATAAAAIAVAVWSETAAKYSTAGSMGFQLAEAESLGALVNAIWDEPKANHTTADTYGEYLDATLSGIGAAGAVTVGSTSVSVIASAVWNATGSSHTSAGSFGARLNVTINSMTAGAIGAVTIGSTSASAVATAVQALALTVGSTSASAIAAATAALAHTIGSTAVAAIQNGLATAAALDAVDNFLDTEVAAIKAKTDLLTFNTANSIAANVTHVINDPVQTNGATDTNWGGAP